MVDTKLSDLSTGALSDDDELYTNDIGSGSRKVTVDSLRNIFLGAAVRAVVVAASTGNGALATAFENGDTLDGVTLSTGDRILLKDQTAGEENGIRVVQATGAPTRATDFDVDAEAIRGATVMVIDGTINANTIWMHTTTGAITLDTTSLTFVQIGGIGKQTLWIPATAMTPTVSNGCADLATIETVAGQPDQHVLGFDGGANDEHAQFEIGFPKAWDKGTVSFRPCWTHQGGQTGGLDGVAWALQGVSIGNDEVFAVAYGSPIVVTGDQANTDRLFVAAESAAITIAGTPAVDEVQFFRVFRDVSDGADDLNIDAQLVGLWLFFTTDKATDD